MQAKTAVVLRGGQQFRAHFVARAAVLRGYLGVGIRAISVGLRHGVGFCRGAKDLRLRRVWPVFSADRVKAAVTPLSVTFSV